MLNTLSENDWSKIDRFASRIDQEHNLHEKAFFFQHEGKRLFGILHRPLNISDGQRKIGIVMCQPYLVEPLITQRLEIDIARSLAQNGFSVFRFHYRGCGDSEGDFKDTTLSSQISDTAMAIKVFTEQEDLDSIGLLGIRLGGTVALMAAEVEKRIEFVVLCEPIIEPKSCFLDLFRTAKFSAVVRQEKIISTEQMIQHLMTHGMVTVLGYPLYKEIFVETASFNLMQSAKYFSGKTLLIQVSGLSIKVTKAFRDLGNQIQKNGGSCDITLIHERRLAWNFILHPPFRSEKIVQTILQWCKKLIVCPANKVII
ncbi:MAG: alpha/beta hydrolase [Candidatus Brocadia sp.]|jgi:alpha/beta superfamily hydrolase|uniref:Alpha/beta hydrolase family protein n=1 Tax=Candidatus Brocadia fulgida TaxID=380242 RepID=A0A0M2UYU0_9BACT|nr:MAG: Alpha/beta hydrolase family protein [Candidatus Brocadia fulgida]MCC6325482.1 alpha/beta hydrolase [Candidatus Brocadia sp.]MCE7910196.1 hypothetical protein [Candidatus Brocadia sp. AMX3]OQZ03161.1 MAG: hypothetical protein B6D35_00250 [Candidatus Brocadia sp. UTAMX2]MBV6517711.1 hypothetical protein [Candidatus Brocadia fulgida]